MAQEIDIDEPFKNEMQDLEYFNEFPIEDSLNLTYNEFFEKYLLKNRPCLITNVSNNWKATKYWVKNDLPNFNYLDFKYGDIQVSITECMQDDYLQKPKVNWKFKDYIKYWEDNIDNPKDNSLYYLKDWHLKNLLPNDDFYEVPVYFASDWLNEYLVENSKDDYRFVYMGIKGTWTPFHVDVMTSHSWSTNICGLKRWIIFPPGEEKLFCDDLGNLPQDIEHLTKDQKYFEVYQHPGDAIFVPTNWYHQVWNVKDTISINHNWINGCNLDSIWDSMKENLSQIKNEIKDCQNMDNFLDHCQVMLRALFGFNFTDFYNFILYIACKRVELIQNGIVINLSENRQLGKNHALYDLLLIQKILTLFIEHSDVEPIDTLKSIEMPPKVLLSKIQTTLCLNK